MISQLRRILFALLALWTLRPTHAQIRIVSPNGGERLVAGSVDTLRWTGSTPGTTVTLEYSTNDGATWIVIQRNVSGSSYAWTVPATISTACLFRVTTPFRVFSDSVLADGVGHSISTQFIWSPDDRFIGLGGGQEIINSSDLSRYFKDTISNDPNLGFSRDTRKVLFRNPFGAWLVDLQTKTYERLYQFHLAFYLLWSPVDGRFLTIGDSLIVWDSSSNAAELASMKKSAWTYTQNVQWSPDGTHIAGTLGRATATSYNYATVWDASTGDSLLSLPGDVDFVSAVAYNAQGTRLATIGYDSIIQIWNPSSGGLVSRIATPIRMDPNTARWSPNGTRIAVGTASDSVMIFDVSNGRHILSCHVPSAGAVSNVEWSPDGRWIVAYGFSPFLEVFDASTGAHLQTVYDTANRVSGPVSGSGLSFSHDTTRLLCVDGYGRVGVFFLDPAPGDTAVSASRWSIVATGAATVTLRVNDVAARQGERIDIPLFVDNPTALAASGATSIHGTLRYNSTMLVAAVSAQSIALPDASIDFDVAIPAAPETLLAVLPFTATLGNDSLTNLELFNVSSDSPTLTIIPVNGSFRLLDICPAGGPRLINPNGTAFAALAPNPVRDELHGTLQLIEDGSTEVVIVDMKGARVKSVLHDVLTHGLYDLTIDVRSLSSGSYTLIVTTSSLMLRYPIVISR